MHPKKNGLKKHKVAEYIDVLRKSLGFAGSDLEEVGLAADCRKEAS